MVPYWIAIHGEVYVNWQMANLFESFMHFHDHICLLEIQLHSRKTRTAVHILDGVPFG